MSRADAIYLDNAATTPLAREIADRLTELYAQTWANPSSQHRAGRRALAALEDAKDRIKAICLGTGRPSELQAWQLVITSGGTEANNLAISGLAGPNAGSILVSAVEHPSVLAMATEADVLAGRSHVVPVDGAGQVNIDALDSLLGAAGPHPLVSIMVGNNETGIVQDLAQVAEVCRSHAAVLHCDAVQALGKLPTDDFAPWVDALSVTAHKLHGPVGVGALLVRGRIALKAMLHGGGQQLGLRPGTESVPLVEAMAATCELAEQARISGAMQQVAALRERFETGLTAAGIGAEIIGQQVRRLPHISAVAFPGLDRQGLLMALDMAGVQCSSGSACASGSSQSSHVLTAMQLPPVWVEGAIRFSFSRLSTAAEVDAALERVSNVVQKLRKRG